MTHVLDLCQGFPRRAVARGETLIEEGVRKDRLFVLERGAFEVVRGGVAVIRIAQPGAFLGEISAVLECAPSATLVAAEDSCVIAIDDASAQVRAMRAVWGRMRGELRTTEDESRPKFGRRKTKSA